MDVGPATDDLYEVREPSYKLAGTYYVLAGGRAASRHTIAKMKMTAIIRNASEKDPVWSWIRPARNGAMAMDKV